VTVAARHDHDHHCDGGAEENTQHSTEHDHEEGTHRDSERGDLTR
jgi:hypothetical protein